MLSLKIKDFPKKIFTWRYAIILNSILALLILSCLTLFKLRLVDQLQEISFIDNICSNDIVYHSLAFIIMMLVFTVNLKFSTKRFKLWQIFLITLASNAYKYLIFVLNVQFLNVFLDFIYLFIFVLIWKGSKLRYILISICTILVQVLLSLIHSYWLNDIVSNHISIYFILNIDLFIVIYNMYKGGEVSCGNVHSSGESQVGYTPSQDSFLVSLRSHIILWLESSKIRRKVTKREKRLKPRDKLDCLDIIYVFLYVIWNAFTIFLVYLMARSENKILEMILLCVAFVINKGIFGKPLHLSADICFIVSLIVFYMLSKSIPKSSLSILMPVLIGISLALISSTIRELIYEDKTISLRQKILSRLDNDVSKEHIYDICKSKGFKDSKSEDIAMTVLTYLDHSLYDTAELMCCDNRTVTRRINEFLK